MKQMRNKISFMVLAAVVFGAANPSVVSANPFEDVPGDHWAYDAVAQLAADGVIEGYGDGTYRGEQEITRYEMAQMVARAMAKGGGDKALIDAVGVICRVFGHDHVYRVGGDEFIAILSTGDTEEIDRLFARFDDALEEENKQDKTYHLPLSISKGCAVFEKEKDTEYKTVFQRADTTMYQDKDAYYAARRRDRQ